MIDKATCSQLFASHSRALLLFARQWVDQASAEDLVQEAFAQLFDQKSSIENAPGWLFASVRHAAIDLSRRGQIHRRHQPHLARPDWFESRADDLIDAQKAQAMLDELPIEQREVIVLRIWGQLTLQDISILTGSAISTLFSRYKTGLMTLKNQLESTCKTSP